MAWSVVEDVLGCPAVMSRTPPVTWPQISQLFVKLLLQICRFSCNRFPSTAVGSLCTTVISCAIFAPDNLAAKHVLGANESSPLPPLGASLGGLGVKPGHRPIPTSYNSLAPITYSSHTPYHSHLAPDANNILSLAEVCYNVSAQNSDIFLYILHCFRIHLLQS